MPPKLVKQESGNRSITSFFRPKAAAPPPTNEPNKRPRLEKPTKLPSPKSSPSLNDLPSPGKAVTTSFSSNRSNSKRVIANGHEVVRGSDTETDDDELPDLSTLIGRTGSKPITATVQSSKAANVRSIASVSQNVVPQPRERKSYKNSLSKLLEQKQRQTALESRLAAVEADLGAFDQDEQDAGRSKEIIRAALVETGDAEDAGKSRRVMEALERTDAFERIDSWQFFDTDLPTPRKRPFPKIRHSNKPLQTMLNDPQRRTQALTSGFLPRLAQKCPLPDELLSWMIEQVCVEKREILVSAYLESICNAFCNGHTSADALLTPEAITTCFEILGARKEAVDLRRRVKHTAERMQLGDLPLNPNMAAFINLLQRLAAVLPTKTKETTLKLLFRASIDARVMKTTELRVRLEEVINLLLHYYLDIEDAKLKDGGEPLLQAIFDSIESVTLRQQLILSLPSFGRAAHLFRRWLALAFVLNHAKHVRKGFDDRVLLARILRLFERGSALRVTSETDYVELRARLDMLDIALDSGFSDFDFIPATSGDAATKAANRDAENDFNEGIDDLTSAVREMAARIMDAGAAHMSRTEAKTTAERLSQRLEFAVRTKEKPPTDWFAANEKLAQQNMLANWMKTEDDQKDRQDANVPEEAAPEPGTSGVPMAEENAVVVAKTEPQGSISKPPEDMKQMVEKKPAVANIDVVAPTSTPTTKSDLNIQTPTKKLPILPGSPMKQRQQQQPKQDGKSKSKKPSTILMRF